MKSKTLFSPIVIVSLLVSITLLLAGTLSKEEPTKTSSLVASNSEIDWRINITGDEENLHVSTEKINHYATRVCVSYINKSAYANDILLKGRFTNNIPVTKLSSHNFTISKTSLDMSKVSDYTEECFYVQYDEIEEGMSFKIGWESVLVDASGDTLATAYEGENICVGVDGNLYVAYIGSGDDLWVGNSSDDGASWSVQEINSGIADKAGIVCHPDGEVTAYYIANSDRMIAANTTDGGITWKEYYLESSDTFVRPSCAVDNNSIMHCCMIENAASDLWYVNTSEVDGGYEVTGLNTIQCDIEINRSGNIYIAVTESVTDDLDFFSSHDGFSSRTSAYDSFSGLTTTNGEGLSIDISRYNDIIHVAIIDNDDLEYLNGTYGSTFSQQVLDTSTSFHPDIMVTEQNAVYITYQNGSGVTEDIIRFNNTGGGAFEKGVLVVDAGFLALADSTQNEQNQVNNSVHYLYTDGTEVYYDNLVTGTELESDPCNYTSGDWEINVRCEFNNTSIDIDGNLTIASGGTLVLRNTTLNFTGTGQYIILDNVATESKLELYGTSQIN